MEENACNAEQVGCKKLKPSALNTLCTVYCVLYAVSVHSSLGWSRKKVTLEGSKQFFFYKVSLAWGGGEGSILSPVFSAVHLCNEVYCNVVDRAVSLKVW